MTGSLKVIGSSLALVTLVFAAGGAWWAVKDGVADAQEVATSADKKADKAIEAAKSAADTVSRNSDDTKRELESIKREQLRMGEKQKASDWMTHQILKRVNPAASEMIPEPPRPRSTD